MSSTTPPASAASLSLPSYPPPRASTSARPMTDDDPDELEQDDDLLEEDEPNSTWSKFAKARPLTIAALEEEFRITWLPQKNQAKADENTYEPINKPVPISIATNRFVPEPPLASTSSSSSSPSTSKLTLNGAAPPPAERSGPSRRDEPFFAAISPQVGWPSSAHGVGSGLHNDGNTCFLNSVLQVLLHTAPLVRYLDEIQHSPKTCTQYRKKQFCMICAMMDLIKKSFNRGNPYTPSVVTHNLKKIAPQMRFGRQEDSHEFLRFVIDGMQASALADSSPKLEQRLKEQTFLHQIFGGRLRSRVSCMSCNHPSDTFDSILDLSLDIHGCSNLKDAFQKFIRVDRLTGSNKYKCEKCKKLVNAEKNFTIDKAPMVLTIHLKRFRATGGKISELLSYPESLDLGGYMSDPSSKPQYRLYGVIYHSGGGPHSGHYTASVRASNGGWYYMNDSSVNAMSKFAPQKTAYVLFYCRERGDALNSAIANGSAKRPRPDVDQWSSTSTTSNGLTNGFKKPKFDSNTVVRTSNVSAPFRPPAMTPAPALPHHSPPIIAAASASSFYGGGGGGNANGAGRGLFQSRSNGGPEPSKKLVVKQLAPRNMPQKITG